MKIMILLALLVSSVLAAPSAVQIIPFQKNAIPKTATYQGNVVGGAHWKDAQGEFIFFVTQTPAIDSKGECATEDGCKDAELYAFCYAIKDGVATQVWKTIDFERNCPFDLYAGLAKDAIFVTDEDKNGIAECSFLYILTCRSDVSPSTLKLIMHEGTTKYAIRGTTIPDESYGIAQGAGIMNVDASFNAANPKVKAFAISKFKEFTHKDSFEQQ